MRSILFAAAFSLAASSTTATECRLSHDDCVIVFQEFAMSDMQGERDAAALRSLTSYERGRRLIILEGERLKRRSLILPRRIGAEMTRMYACDSRERLNAATGASDILPECR